jgi:ribosomal protein L11 methyltransferase
VLVSVKPEPNPNVNRERSTERSEHSVRSWPALDIHPVSELLEAALVDYHATAVDERSADDWRVFFTSTAERDRALAALRAEFPDATIQPVDVPDENWAARSQASLRAVKVGSVIVAPPWDLTAGPQNKPVSTQDELVVVIEPSMGFGTGHHATTRLCLAALQRLGMKERSMLDIGTGSGVLAIAASRLGSTEVTGIDNDADAIASARKNLELNAGANVTLLVGDVRSTRLPVADVVVANLTGGLLVAVAGLLQSLTTRGGRLILSGLMTTEERAVLSAFAGWIVEHRSDEDEWVCLTLRGPH